MIGISLLCQCAIWNRQKGLIHYFLAQGGHRGQDGRSACAPTAGSDGQDIRIRLSASEEPGVVVVAGEGFWTGTRWEVLGIKNYSWIAREETVEMADAERMGNREAEALEVTMRQDIQLLL